MRIRTILAAAAFGLLSLGTASAAPATQGAASVPALVQNDSIFTEVGWRHRHWRHHHRWHHRHYGWRRHYHHRHYGWYRGRHYGWYRRHHHYGWYRRHRYHRHYTWY